MHRDPQRKAEQNTGGRSVAACDHCMGDIAPGGEANAAGVRPSCGARLGPSQTELGEGTASSR